MSVSSTHPWKVLEIVLKTEEMKEKWECRNSLVIDGHNTILAVNTKGPKALIN